MKKLVFLSIMCLFCLLTNAQEEKPFVCNNNVYESVSTRTAIELQLTPYQYKSNRTGKVYDIYINTKNGHCYTKRISEKTGNPYNAKLNENISKDIALKMNIPYIEDKKE